MTTHRKSTARPHSAATRVILSVHITHILTQVTQRWNLIVVQFECCTVLPAVRTQPVLPYRERKVQYVLQYVKPPPKSFEAYWNVLKKVNIPVKYNIICLFSSVKVGRLCENKHPITSQNSETNQTFYNSKCYSFT